MLLLKKYIYFSFTLTENLFQFLAISMANVL